MKITQFEQSGFVIETLGGFKLAIDIGSYTPLEKIAGMSVDALFVSHIHGDHFSIQHIKSLAPKKLYLNRECIEALGEEELLSEIVEVSAGKDFRIDADNISISVFDVDHGPNVKVVPKENFGFLIQVENRKVYFAGDMFYESGIDVSEIDVDVVCIPVGTFYTFGPKEALDFVKKFKSVGEIIPMHYQKNPETKEEFLELVNQHI